MPKRRINSERPVVPKTEYSYESLLVRIRKHIDDVYGGVADFLRHEDFHKKCGFDEGDSNNAKMFTYLALPRPEQEGIERSKRIRSFPVLQKLYKGLLGVDLENSIKVERTQVIKASQIPEGSEPVSV